jgi:hypothetical protein
MYDGSGCTNVSELLARNHPPTVPLLSGIKRLSEVRGQIDSVGVLAPVKIITMQTYFAN